LKDYQTDPVQLAWTVKKTIQARTIRFDQTDPVQLAWTVKKMGGG
jgi:hypothetical protein